MRRTIKNNVLSLIDTLFEAHNEILDLYNTNQRQNALLLLVQCQESAIKIGVTIEDSEGYGTKTVGLLEEYCEKIYQIGEKLEAKTYNLDDKGLLDNKLKNIKISLKEEVQVILEIVFLPYKASMWDSLESIWLAAEKDKNCKCIVIPIPYYNKDENKELIEKQYEGDLFPKDVPITHYNDYNLAEEYPDIIYFHNPYDQFNVLTSVHPDYYSKELKKHTDTLVYVPYYIAETKYDNFEEAKSRIDNIHFSSYIADKIIVQSQAFKKVFELNGIEEGKIEVLGSPKVDAILNSDKYKKDIPKEWQDKLKGGKIFLLSTSIRDMINSKRFFVLMERIVDNFIKDESIKLIWRPHPLMEETIKNLQANSKDVMDRIIKKIRKSSNVIYDKSPNPYLAIALSDALMSDRGSLARLYPFTGKPVLMLYGSEKHTKRYMTLDYFASYFRADGMSITKFIELVNFEKDIKKEERVNRIKKSVVNSDGSCGENIHKKIITLLDKR